MLNESNLPKYFWADAVYTASYVLNRTLIRPIFKKTPYELYKDRKPRIKQFYSTILCSVRLTCDVFVRDLNRQLGTPSHWLPVDS